MHSVRGALPDVDGARKIDAPGNMRHEEYPSWGNGLLLHDGDEHAGVVPEVRQDRRYRSARDECKEATLELVRLAAKDLGSMGHTRVVLKGDSEPAMKALATWVMEMRMHTAVVEESPDDEPQSNGMAERCVQTVMGLFRTARSALENRIGQTLPDDHAVLTWLVRHAAGLHHRIHVGHDGSTPWERLTGKKTGQSVVELGERI